jgi:hypothetical protein
VGLESEDGTRATVYTYNGSPHIIQNQTALRARLKRYDYLVSTNRFLRLSLVKGQSALSGTTAQLNLENAGNQELTWAVEGAPGWLKIATLSGALPGAQRTNIAVRLSDEAASLEVGTYEAVLGLVNKSDGAGDRTITAVLEIQEPAAVLELAQAAGNSFSGGLGGPFSPGALSVSLRNAGTLPLHWTGSTVAEWLSLSPADGVIDPGESTEVHILLGTAAESLSSGPHDAEVLFQNLTTPGASIRQPVHLQINARIEQTSAAIVNGRFQGQLAFPAGTARIIEYSEDLANWFTLDAAGVQDGDTVHFDDALDAAAQRFYRIRGE